MACPFPLLPDPELARLSELLRERRDALWERAAATETAALVAGAPAAVVSAALAAVNADEGSIWLANAAGSALTPVWNNGPDAARFVGSFQLPADQGITGWVFRGGLAACESEVCFHQRQHRALDRQLGVLTWAMLAAPLCVDGETRGVLTGVRLIRAADLPGLEKEPSSAAEFPPGFTPPPSFQVSDLARLEAAAQATGKLLEQRLTAWALGQDD